MAKIHPPQKFGLIPKVGGFDWIDFLCLKKWKKRITSVCFCLKGFWNFSGLLHSWVSLTIWGGENFTYKCEKP